MKYNEAYFRIINIGRDFQISCRMGREETQKGKNELELTKAESLNKDQK